VLACDASSGGDDDSQAPNGLTICYIQICVCAFFYVVIHHHWRGSSSEWGWRQEGCWFDPRPGSAELSVEVSLSKTPPNPNCS